MPSEGALLSQAQAKKIVGPVFFDRPIRRCRIRASPIDYPVFTQFLPAFAEASAGQALRRKP